MATCKNWSSAIERVADLVNVMDRRQFLKGAGGVVGSLLAGPTMARSLTDVAGSRVINAVAFDALAIFDPRPVFATIQEAYPNQGKELCEAWRVRQFEYTWLRSTAHQYVDFWQVTQDALSYAAKKVHISLSSDDLRGFMDIYLKLGAWPDVLETLNHLKSEGFRLALLSNFTPIMLNSCVKSAGLGGMFDSLISTDMAKTFKPDPRAYQLGIDTLHVARDRILFVPFGAWDAAGAKQFGYKTFWVNRQNQQPEELGVSPDGVGLSLEDLLRFLNTSLVEARRTDT